MNVAQLAEMTGQIDFDPHYQRQGDVWSLSKQQTFIDSLINGFAIPSMFWHESIDAPTDSADIRHPYAIVDGKQRHQAILDFIGGEFGLAEDFTVLETDEEPGGLTAEQLLEDKPLLYARFKRAELEVVIVQTSDLELIEELYFRLNEGAPLSAAEKRMRGPIAPQLVKQLQQRPFFEDKLPWPNTRFRHFDLIAKLLHIEERDPSTPRIPDLRKRDLDDLFERLNPSDNDADQVSQTAEALKQRVESRLAAMEETYDDQDRLLASVGLTTVLYALHAYLTENNLPAAERHEIAEVESRREEIRGRDTTELQGDELLLNEFNALAQGTTSGAYLTRRLEILLALLGRTEDAGEGQA